MLLSSVCCVLTAPLPYILYWLAQRGCLTKKLQYENVYQNNRADLDNQRPDNQRPDKWISTVGPIRL